MDRLGVTAGRAGVDLTVGILNGPRRRVEISDLGQGRGAHRDASRGRATGFWAYLSFRKDPSDESIEGLEPDEVSLGVHQGAAEGRQTGPRSQVADGRALGGVLAEPARPSGGPWRMRSLRIPSRAFVTKDTNAHNL